LRLTNSSASNNSEIRPDRIGQSTLGGNCHPTN
jgi:hypothetical protein